MSKINLVGCDETVDMPIEIEMANGVLVNFTVQFERMTRPEVKRLNSIAVERRQEAMTLSYKMVDATTLEGQLQSESDPKVKKEIKDKIGKDTTKALKARMEQLEEEADEDVISRIKGWTGLRGKDKKNIKFSDAALREMMASQPYFDALSAAQWDATGNAAKN